MKTKKCLHEKKETLPRLTALTYSGDFGLRGDELIGPMEMSLSTSNS